MRGLTLTQPWAGLVAAGVKLVENRPRHPPHNMIGERFAVHASREIDREAWRRIIEIDPTVALDYPGSMAHAARVHHLAEVTSAVIAVATLDHVVFDETGMLHEDIRRDLGVQYRWYSGDYGYVLRDVFALPAPVRCKGMLGFWTLPSDVESAVRTQLPCDAGGTHVCVGRDIQCSKCLREVRHG